MMAAFVSGLRDEDFEAQQSRRGLHRLIDWPGMPCLGDEPGCCGIQLEDYGNEVSRIVATFRCLQVTDRAIVWIDPGGMQ
jgi:hypothetical protein